MKKLLAIVCGCFLATIGFSQAYYFVGFADKGNPSVYSADRPEEFLSERAIARRLVHAVTIDSSDFPVHAPYLDALRNLGLSLKHTSKWLNGATVFAADTSVMAQVRCLPFVVFSQRTQLIENAQTVRLKKLQFEKANYGAAAIQTAMLRVDSLHTLGYKGDNMHVAVIDAGFYKVNENQGFERFRNNGQLLGTKDFVSDTSDIFSENRHGMYVLSTIVGYLPENYLGTAPNASCWLLRTEDDLKESLLELDNWVAAVEFADSAGVDVITSSLGYTKFDDESTNFTRKDLNGKTARNSIVATIAARKGILIFNSAGNEGNGSWHYISVPADADSILTVGSVDAERQKSGFSSFGPTADGRVKPDICAMGSLAALINEWGSTFAGNGTSFATPIMAGAAICLWQALPNLSNIEIIELIRSHSSQSLSPDSLQGYGIPDMVAAYYGAPSHLDMTQNPVLSVYPNPVSDILSVTLPDNGIAAVEVIDVLGRKFWRSSSLAFGCKIDCQSFPKGIYFVNVTMNNRRYVAKFIKE